MSLDAAHSHRQRKLEEERARVERKRAEIKRMCSRLPAVHQTWTASDARDFKAAAANGMTVINNPRASEALIDSALKRLEQFYY